jgi:hypothetical protein
MRFEGVVLDAAVLGLPAVRVDGQLRVLMQVAVKLLLPAAHLAEASQHRRRSCLPLSKPGEKVLDVQTLAMPETAPPPAS